MPNYSFNCRQQPFRAAVFHSFSPHLCVEALRCVGTLRFFRHFEPFFSRTSVFSRKPVIFPANMSFFGKTCLFSGTRMSQTNTRMFFSTAPTSQTDKHVFFPAHGCLRRTHEWFFPAHQRLRQTHESYFPPCLSSICSY